MADRTEGERSDPAGTDAVDDPRRTDGAPAASAPDRDGETADEGAPADTADAESAGDGADGDATDGEDADTAEDSAADGQAARDATGDDADEAAADRDEDAATLAARVELLEAENQRLRTAHEQAVREQYRRSALAFALVGLAALVGAALFPTVRDVLLGLAGIGVFAAVLLVSLVPERLVPASVGQAIYGSLADTERALAAELGLRGDPHYVSTDPGPGNVRLYLPQASDATLPPRSSLGSTFVVGDAYRGLAVEPTGAELVDEFAAASGELPDAPGSALEALGEAIREQFELAGTVETEYADDLATLRVEDSRLGDPTRPDHPIQSVVGVGLAAVTGRPVVLVDADRPAGDENRGLITFRIHEE